LDSGAERKEERGKKEKMTTQQFEDSHVAGAEDETN
jgi:hypothetical protein